MKKKKKDISYTKKYQDHAACSYDYKLISIDEQCSQLFKSYFGEDSVYKFICDMIEQSYCPEMINNKFNKLLFMCKKRI